jgi:hypothetical protein
MKIFVSILALLSLVVPLASHYAAADDRDLATKSLTEFSTMTATDAAADYVPVWDASAGEFKRVLTKNIWGTATVPSAVSVGATTLYTYSNDALADDGSFNLPSAIVGLLAVTAVYSTNYEGALYQVNTDGVVTKLAGSTNAVATDTDAKLCVFDGGTYGTVRNRLGGTAKVRAFMVD